MRIIPIIRAESLIPPGPYCYVPDPDRTAAEGVFPIIACPFWRTQPDPNNLTHDQGWCEYLKSGDAEDEGLGLLWDQVKACGIKDDGMDADEQDVRDWLKAACPSRTGVAA